MTATEIPLTTDQVIGALMAHQHSYRSICGRYYVDFWGDRFTVQAPGLVESTAVTVTEEELQQEFEDVEWVQFPF